MATDNQAVPMAGLFTDDSIIHFLYVITKTLTTLMTQMMSKVKVRSIHALKMKSAYSKCLDTILVWREDQQNQNATAAIEQFQQIMNFYKYTYVQYTFIYSKTMRLRQPNTMTIPTLGQFLHLFYRNCLESVYIRDPSFLTRSQAEQLYETHVHLRATLAHFAHHTTFNPLQQTVPQVMTQDMHDAATPLQDSFVITVPPATMENSIKIDAPAQHIDSTRSTSTNIPEATPVENGNLIQSTQLSPLISPRNDAMDTLP